VESANRKNAWRHAFRMSRGIRAELATDDNVRGELNVRAAQQAAMVKAELTV
jgi:hypothetical protein